VKAFYWKAYEVNLTGLSAMVAYNLLLSILPLALVALFVAGRLLDSEELERAVLADLGDVFPSTAEDTIATALERIRDSNTGFGVAALAASVWIGSSFWGALDTAFCAIYHVRCRSWLEQKRFAIAMLVVSLLLIAATVAVPTVQSALLAGAESLPFGLSEAPAVALGASLAIGLVLLFGVLCVVLWAVPNRLVPWRFVWPGALAATGAIAVVDYGFPLYLSSASTLSTLGGTLVLTAIVLIWFYVVAIVILGGAVVNAMRFETAEGTAKRQLGEAAAPEPETL